MKAKWMAFGLCVAMQTGWAAAPVEEAHGFVTVSETAQPAEDHGFRVEPADQPVAQRADMSGDTRLLVLAQQVDRLTQQVQDSQRQIAQLKGRLEEHAHQLGQLQKHTGSVAKKSFTGGSYFSAAKVKPAAKSLSETDSYQVAFNLLMHKHYAKAKVRFYTYLKQFPQGQYGSNVNYWLGEIALIEKQYSEAEHAFSQVIKLYPHSGKYADAQYKLAITHLRMGQMGQARKEFEIIEREHAGKTVARLAKLQLQQMV